MPVTTVDELFQVLEKSELLTTEQLQEARSSGASEPKAIARYLIQHQLATGWQARILMTGRHAFRLGKYILLDRLNANGASDIYLAKHAQLGRQVEIKTLSKAALGDKERLKKLLKEAREVAKLDHQNITQLYDIDRDGSRFFLVMEYCEGEQLGAVVQDSGPLDKHTVAEFIRQAAEGLGHAHEQGILHRNVNPKNLVVDQEGNLKLLNLGVGQLFDSEEDGQANGIAPKDFLAPEQQVGKYEHRSDIFGLGRTGLYLLNGTIPNGSSKPGSVLEKILYKMCLSDPNKRLQTSQQVASLLKKWITENPPPPVDEAAEDAFDELEPAEDGDGGFDELQPDPDPVDMSVEPTSDDVNGIPSVDLSQANDLNESAPAALSSPLDKVAAAETPPKDADAPTKKSNGFPKLAYVGIAGAALFTLCVWPSLMFSLVWVLFLRGQTEAMAQNAQNSIEQAANGSVETIDASDTGEEADGESESDESTDEEGADDSGDESSESGDDMGNENSGDGEPGDGSDEPTEGEQTDSEMPMDNPDQPSEGSEDTSTEKVAGTNDTENPEEGSDTTTTETKSEEKPKPKPVPVDSFAGLPKTAELPPLGTSEEPAEGYDQVKVLGNVKLEDADLLLITIEGGEVAYKSGKEKYSIENALGGTALRDFEIYLNKTEDDKVLIANLGFKDNKVQFQWTSNAVKEPAANYLRNCVLSLLSGASATDLALRSPVALDPIALDFTKGAKAKVMAQADYLPDPPHIRAEILHVTGRKVLPQFDPDKEFEGSGETRMMLAQQINLPGGKRMLPAYVEFKSVTRRTGFELAAELKVAYLRNGNFSPAGYVEKKVKQGKEERDKVLGIMNLKLAEMEKQKLALGKKNQRAAQQIQLQINEAKGQVAAIQEVANALNSIDQHVAAMKAAKIHAHVFFMAGDYKVTLARFGQPRQNKKPAKK